MASNLSTASSRSSGTTSKVAILQRGACDFWKYKGRVTEADTVTVTKNEIMYSLNKPEDFVLAMVEFIDAEHHQVHYLREPFRREPDFGVTSVNYDFDELRARAESPT